MCYLPGSKEKPSLNSNLAFWIINNASSFKLIFIILKIQQCQTISKSTKRSIAQKWTFPWILNKNNNVDFWVMLLFVLLFYSVVLICLFTLDCFLGNFLGCLTNCFWWCACLSPCNHKLLYSLSGKKQRAKFYFLWFMRCLISLFGKSYLQF